MNMVHLKIILNVLIPLSPKFLLKNIFSFKTAHRGGRTFCPGEDAGIILKHILNKNSGRPKF